MKLSKTQRALLAALIRLRRRAEATEYQEPQMNDAEKRQRKSAVPSRYVSGRAVPGVNIKTWCALERAGVVTVEDGWWMAKTKNEQREENHGNTTG